jgi:hypothetical protein
VHRWHQLVSQRVISPPSREPSVGAVASAPRSALRPKGSGSIQGGTARIGWMVGDR